MMELAAGVTVIELAALQSETRQRNKNATGLVRDILLIGSPLDSLT